MFEPVTPAQITAVITQIFLLQSSCLRPSVSVLLRPSSKWSPSLPASPGTAPAPRPLPAASPSSRRPQHYLATAPVTSMWVGTNWLTLFMKARAERVGYDDALDVFYHETLSKTGRVIAFLWEVASNGINEVHFNLRIILTAVITGESLHRAATHVITLRGGKFMNICVLGRRSHSSLIHTRSRMISYSQRNSLQVLM